jgi:hypothetical protein
MVEVWHHQFSRRDIEISEFIGYVHISFFSSSFVTDYRKAEMTLGRV